MWPDFVVVSTPILHFLPCVVKAQEPMRVQAFVSELAIESMKLLNGRIHDAIEKMAGGSAGLVTGRAILLSNKVRRCFQK